MVITSSEDYLQNCFEESNDFTGICFIPSSELVVGREFILDLYCLVDCSLTVGGYYSRIFAAEIDKSYTLRSMDDFGLAQMIEIDLPVDVEFDQIAILASIDNYDTLS